jgi:hypothetical protein
VRVGELRVGEEWIMLGRNVCEFVGVLWVGWVGLGDGSEEIGEARSVDDGCEEGSIIRRPNAQTPSFCHRLDYFDR